MRRYFRSFLSKNPCKFNFHNSFHSLLGLTKERFILQAKEYLNGHKPFLTNFFSVSYNLKTIAYTLDTSYKNIILLI